MINLTGKRSILRQSIALLLVSLLVIGNLSTLKAAPGRQIEIDKSASSWAIPELRMAYQYGLTYPGIMKEFRKPITREEFCTIVVKLYEKLSKKTATGGTNPFVDTNNPEIIKAYHLGIVTGIGQGKFAPFANITRQEICVMIYRALGKAIPSLVILVDSVFPFVDTDQIASWALEAMKFAFHHSIMTGVEGNRIDPRSKTTREQGIVLLKRTYESFLVRPIKGTINIQPPMIGRPLPEKTKFVSMDHANRINDPRYKTNLTLYVAGQGSKPTKLPGINGSPYTKANQAVLITPEGNQEVWFAFTTERIIPSTFLWQVSKVPFLGYATNWKNPPLLVGNGTIPGSSKEFSINFTTLGSSHRLQSFLNIPIKRLLTRAQQPYYVRVIPLDKTGTPIGDPGTGICVLYGQVQPSSYTFLQDTKPLFELWTNRRSVEPNNKPEFSDPMEHLPVISIDIDTKSDHWFMYKGYIAGTKSVWLQVANQPFSTKAVDWENPRGLQYKKVYANLPVSLTAYGKDCVPIPFGEFIPPKSTLKEGEYVSYYVRAIAVRNSATPGADDVSFSEVINVQYKHTKPVEIYKTVTVVAKTLIPTIKVTNYQPVQWEKPDWAHHYVVYRSPLWNEINCKWRNVKTGEVLMPYSFYFIPSSPVFDKSISIEKYEKEIIPRVLPVGCQINFETKEEDKSWWEELWDGIVSFFQDLFNVVKNLVNQVAKAYEACKTGLTTWIAQNLPGIPDSWRDELKKALDALVNAGLAALGIPPTLPNFDDLTNLSLDYLAEMACAEAGIPLDGLGGEVLNQTKGAIKSEIEKAAKAPAPNPIDSPFLRNNQSYLYRPGFIDVTISNDYDVPSLQTNLNLDAGWEWREGITLDHEVWAQLPINQQYGEALAYYLHFTEGLRRGFVGYPMYYPVFESMRGILIPSMPAHTSTTLRIYLNEFTSGVYPFAKLGDEVQWEDFAHMYWGELGVIQFYLYTDKMILPSPRDAAISQGFKEQPKTIYSYYYDKPYQDYFSFKSVPCNSWKP